jgi:hypothetical protein
VVLGFYNFSAADARCADAHAFGSAFYFGTHRPQVEIPSPTRDVVGVADGISKLRPSAADIANLCHDDSREIKNLMRKR